MTEELISLPASDGDHLIYARQARRMAHQVVLHVNGLPGNMGDLLDVTASEYFEENGADHLRFGFYEAYPRARRLSAVTLSDHVADLQTVLHFCETHYDDIFVTAHSLGGLVTLVAQSENVAPHLRAISFWDPAFDVKRFWAHGNFLEPLSENLVILKYGIDTLVNEKYVAEISSYPDERCRALAHGISIPVQMLIAGDGSLFYASPQATPEAYAQAFPGAFDLATIPQANHRFTQRGTRQKLFMATRRWFERFGLKPSP